MKDAKPEVRFSTRTVAGEDTLSVWERGDGTQWMAAMVPARGKARLMVQRRTLDGRVGIPMTMAEGLTVPVHLLAEGSDEGWAVVAWASASKDANLLQARVRTPDGWLPTVALGSIDLPEDELSDNCWVAGPDRRGRMALAWIRKGTLLTAGYEPVRGWGPPEVQDEGVEQALWGDTRDGNRLLVWGKRAKGTALTHRSWTPAKGWNPPQHQAMPLGHLPTPVLFEDGRGILVGLAETGEDRVRPWCMVLAGRP